MAKTPKTAPDDQLPEIAAPPERSGDPAPSAPPISGADFQQKMLPSPGRLTVELSPGEFLDRRAILLIKTRLLSADRAKAATAQLARLLDSVSAGQLMFLLSENQALAGLAADLGVVNERLWNAEDVIRQRDAKAFHISHISDFARAAQTIYRLNDQRSRLKTQIDALFGLAPEPKCYTPYKNPFTE